MFEPEKLEFLLQDLRRAHENTIAAQLLVDEHKYNMAVAEARVFLEMEFIGKNAEARQREFTIALADDKAIKGMRTGMRECEQQLAEAKAVLEITREALKCWRALSMREATE